MNYKMIGRFVSMILFVEAVFMIPALIFSMADAKQNAVVAFLISMALTLFVSVILYLFCKGKRTDFYAREGLLSVGIGWTAMSLFGALPFWISGEIPSFIDALFEIVSGFSTTGASVLSDVESLSRGMLYFRSFSNWVGGMGVLVFLLAIAPQGGKNEGFTMHLLRAESPGPDVGKLMPRMRQTAMMLYLSYIVLTVLNFVVLLFCRMPIFDSLCAALSTAGTGGFGIKNDGFAGYAPSIQIVTTVFMFLFGINFSCYYFILLGRLRSVFKDEELRFYILMILSSIGLIVWNLRGAFDTLGETIRHSAFQVVSVMTTTGFSTVDFDLWPSFSKTILVILMFIGGCAGSTGGGMKCARVLLLFKSLARNVSQLLHPNRVRTVRTSGRTVDERILANTDAYFSAYIIILLVSVLVISLDDFSFTTNFTATLSCLNNIGPGLEAVGPTCNYGDFSILSKLVLSLNMLLGRLEIFPILVLFHPKAWTRR